MHSFLIENDIRYACVVPSAPMSMEILTTLERMSHVFTHLEISVYYEVETEEMKPLDRWQQADFDGIKSNAAIIKNLHIDTPFYFVRDVYQKCFNVEGEHAFPSLSKGGGRKHEHLFSIGTPEPLQQYSPMLSLPL